MKPNEKCLENLKLPHKLKVQCNHCGELFGRGNIGRHIPACKKNPDNIRQCPVCKVSYAKPTATCSYACRNTLFGSGENNPNWKQSNYKSTCFLYHDRKCIVCGESKIVAVHHKNEDRTDNRPENLIPMCPTHHQYVHSRYRDEVQPIIDKYVEDWHKRQ